MPKLSKNIQSEMKGVGFEFFPEEHVYLYEGKPMTGVTTLLGILAKPQLIPWAARMAVEYVKEKGTLVSNPIEQGEGEPIDGDFYQIYAGDLEEAKTAYAKKRDDAAQKGTNTHALVEEWIKLCIEKNSGWVMDTVEPRFEPIDSFITWASEQNVQFIASEEKLYSESLFVAGTADFIFEKDGKRYIGDIKTYKKIWDRTPFYQCAGYALMFEEMGLTTLSIRDELLAPRKHEIDGYCIFNLPKEREHNPKEDVLWSFDVEGDTKAFLACVEIYRQNANFSKPKYK